MPFRLFTTWLASPPVPLSPSSTGTTSDHMRLAACTRSSSSGAGSAKSRLLSERTVWPKCRALVSRLALFPCDSSSVRARLDKETI